MVNVINKWRSNWLQKENTAKLSLALLIGEDWHNIKQGEAISFEGLPQPELSDVNLYVGGKIVHHFSTAQFLAYELLDANAKKVCSMIFNAPNGAEPYLALSKIIPDQHKSHLCPREDFTSISNGEMPQHLYVRENTAGMNEWLAMRYELQLDNVRGTSITISHDVRSYNYSLYVANDAPKALEIERYPSGECVISATIFVSLNHAKKINNSAVRKVSELQKNNISVKNIELDKNHRLNNDSFVQSNSTKTVNNVQTSADLVGNAVSVVDKITKKITHLHVAGANDDERMESKNIAAKVKTKANNSVINAVSDADYGTVRCNLRMAGKLIDEALRSDMRVVDIMRKALGLSVSNADLVAFDLGLSAADYKILADRFDLSINDKAAINALIMEELSHFAGGNND
jgi:hypothetical protein